MLNSFYLNKSFRPDVFLYDQIGQPYVPIGSTKETVVTVNELKEHLKLPLTCDSLDLELYGILCAVENFAESYTGRTFIAKTFRTFRDYFPSYIELRRTPFIELISFDYRKDGVSTFVDPNIFYITQGVYFNRIELLNNKEWPSDGDNDRKQSISIDFIAGYGNTGKDVPCDIKLAMLNHASKIYTDRGDCMPCGCTSEDASASLPGNSQLLYNKYRLKSIDFHTGC